MRKNDYVAPKMEQVEIELESPIAVSYSIPGTGTSGNPTYG